MSEINKDAAREDYESMRRLLNDIRYLIRYDFIPAVTKLQAIDEAAAKGITDGPQAACGYLRSITFGFPEDFLEDKS